MNRQPWPWPDSMDAVVATPTSHRVRPLVQWMDPEGPHSVENVDQRRYHAIRVELK